MLNMSKEVSERLYQNEKDKENIKIDIDELRNSIDKKTEVAINSLRKKAQLDEYCNLSDLGNNFRVKIGAKTMGKLLRVVGIAQSSRYTTTKPYHSLCPKFAVTSSFTDNYGNTHQTFKWNYNNCLKKIDEWLQNHDLYEDFYAVATERKMEKFINDLHTSFVE